MIIIVFFSILLSVLLASKAPSYFPGYARIIYEQYAVDEFSRNKLKSIEQSYNNAYKHIMNAASDDLCATLRVFEVVMTASEYECDYIDPVVGKKSLIFQVQISDCLKQHLLLAPYYDKLAKLAIGQVDFDSMRRVLWSRFKDLPDGLLKTMYEMSCAYKVVENALSVSFIGALSSDMLSKMGDILDNIYNRYLLLFNHLRFTDERMLSLFANGIEDCTFFKLGARKSIAFEVAFMKRNDLKRLWNKTPDTNIFVCDEPTEINVRKDNLIEDCKKKKSASFDFLKMDFFNQRLSKLMTITNDRLSTFDRDFGVSMIPFTWLCKMLNHRYPDERELSACIHHFMMGTFEAVSLQVIRVLECMDMKERSVKFVVFDHCTISSSLESFHTPILDNSLKGRLLAQDHFLLLHRFHEYHVKSAGKLLYLPNSHKFLKEIGGLKDYINLMLMRFLALIQDPEHSKVQFDSMREYIITLYALNHRYFDLFPGQLSTRHELFD